MSTRAAERLSIKNTPQEPVQHEAHHAEANQNSCQAEPKELPISLLDDPDAQCSSSKSKGSSAGDKQVFKPVRSFPASLPDGFEDDGSHPSPSFPSLSNDPDAPCLSSNSKGSSSAGDKQVFKPVRSCPASLPDGFDDDGPGPGCPSLPAASDASRSFSNSKESSSASEKQVSEPVRSCPASLPDGFEDDDPGPSCPSLPAASDASRSFSNSKESSSASEKQVSEPVRSCPASLPDGFEDGPGPSCPSLPAASDASHSFRNSKESSSASEKQVSEPVRSCPASLPDGFVDDDMQCVPSSSAIVPSVPSTQKRVSAVRSSVQSFGLEPRRPSSTLDLSTVFVGPFVIAKRFHPVTE